MASASVARRSLPLINAFQVRRLAQTALVPEGALLCFVSVCTRLELRWAPCSLVLSLSLARLKLF